MSRRAIGETRWLSSKRKTLRLDGCWLLQFTGCTPEKPTIRHTAGTGQAASRFHTHTNHVISKSIALG
jgi:hypothetical protein